jgi:hypothetical protein
MRFQTELLSKDTPVSTDKFDEMLGCLPPERMASNAFLVGEPTKHGKDLSGNFSALYELYFSENNQYFYGGLASVDDFDTFIIPSI